MESLRIYYKKLTFYNSSDSNDRHLVSPLLLYSKKSKSKICLFILNSHFILILFFFPPPYISQTPGRKTRHCCVIRKHHISKKKFLKSPLLLWSVCHRLGQEAKKIFFKPTLSYTIPSVWIDRP